MINLGINGVGGASSSGASSVSRVTSALSSAQTLNTQPSSTLDTVSLSNRSSADTARALRTLSDASSLVSIGIDAASEVKTLVTEAEEISVALQAANSSEQTTALESDLDSIFSRIDEIASETEFNGQAIVDSGARTLVIDPSPTDNTSNDVVSVSIPDLAISRTSLGIDSLSSGADISTDPGSAEKTFEDAINSVEFVIQSLSLSQQDIVDGVSTIAGNSFASENFSITEAEALADGLATAIEEASNLDAFQPDSLQVEELIA